MCMMPPLTEVLQGLQVLVVDDHEDSCEFLRFALEDYQMQVQTALSVAQALDVVRQFQPDIALIDLHLPEEDGYALLRHLRQLEPLRGGKAITIATTADRTQGEPKVLGAGFTKLLWKPIDIAELVALLADLIRAEEGMVCVGCG